MAIFTQSFDAANADGTIASFDPSQDTIDLQGIGDISEVTVTGVDGGTEIGTGHGRTLLIEGVTPEQLGADNVTIDGGAIPKGPSGSDLESIVNDLAAGNDLIIGGIANNTIDGGAGDDTIRGFMGHDTIIGGEGDDTLSGMRGKDYLDGGEGDDFLDGGRGVDTLLGGAGDDILDGGGANDTLTGGEGSDTFVQDFSVSGNDTITDFNPSEDTIEFRGAENIYELSITEVDGGTLIDAGTGNSLFVAGVTPEQLGTDNVTIGGEALTLGPDDTLKSVLSDLAAESQQDGINIEGFQGSQEFVGGDGDDTLAGGDGDDTLAGGAGDDTLAGGRGDDTLEGGAGDDTLTGGRNEDILTGGAGDDTLVGGKGDDTLTGGEGSDTFVQDFGEQGADTITDFNPAQDTIDLQGFGGVQNISRVTVTEVDGGTVIGAGSGNTLLIEGVTPDQLGANNITVDGEALAVGSSGSDLGSIVSDLGGNESEAADVNLQGGNRDDTIAGGAGDDVIKGGGGEDTLEGGAGDDVIKGGAGDDTLAGGRGDDTLEGGTGDDTLAGGAGDDTLTGGKGDDTLTGGEGSDTFVQDFGGKGADTITDFNPAQDTIDLQGLGEDNLAVEAVDGGTLISAGEDNSLFVANVTPEQLAASNITVDGQAPTNDSPLGSILSTFDTAIADEDVLSTDNEQVVAEDLILGGGRGEDTLEGGAGDDRLRGRGGDDTLEGGAGDDILRGDKGDDTLDGGAGDDRLIGGTGEDTLEGGAGDDTLTGGKGDDTFIQDFGQPGEDTITDFNPNQDVIDFGGLNDFENISISEVDGNTLISAGEGNTLTINNITPDQLSADNVKINGEAPSADNFNLQNTLSGAASEVAVGGLDALSGALGGDDVSTDGTASDADPIDSALGNALDSTAQQGGAPAGGAAGAGGDAAAGLDIVVDDVQEDDVDDAQVDEVA